APESAIVFAGRPLIVFWFEQDHGKRQPETRQRFGQGDDVRRNAGLFETEERAGAAAASLNVVNDEQNAMAAADRFQGFQPALAGDVQTAFTLYRFNDYGCGSIHSARGVSQHFVEQAGGIQPVAHVAIVGHATYAAQGYAAA